MMEFLVIYFLGILDDVCCQKNLIQVLAESDALALFRRMLF